MYYFSRNFLSIMFWIMFLISKLFREDIFKDCGEVVDVRFNTDREGRFRGFGYVEFGTAEAAKKVSVCPDVVCANHFSVKNNSEIVLPL
jgi:RNA recognition motif-containing protein